MEFDLSAEQLLLKAFSDFYQKRAVTAHLQLSGIKKSSCSPCWMHTADAQSYRYL